MTAEYATLVAASRLIPPASDRLAVMDALAADLTTTAELLPVTLGDRGRHYPHTVIPVDADWSPLPPWERQAIAPTHYADRVLPGQDGMTGRLDTAAILAADPADTDVIPAIAGEVQ